MANERPLHVKYASAVNSNTNTLRNPTATVEAPEYCNEFVQTSRMGSIGAARLSLIEPITTGQISCMPRLQRYRLKSLLALFGRPVKTAPSEASERTNAPVVFARLCLERGCWLRSCRLGDTRRCTRRRAEMPPSAGSPPPRPSLTTESRS